MAQDVINQAETKLNVKLPETLKTLYNRHKGGYTNYCFYPLVLSPNLTREDWKNINPEGEIFPPSRLESLGNLSDEVDFEDEDISYRSLFSNTDQLIVLSRHGWDMSLCLDYRKNGSNAEPEVVYLEEIKGLTEIIRIPNFNTFFSGLRKKLES